MGSRQDSQQTELLRQRLQQMERSIRTADGGYNLIAKQQADEIRRRLAESERLDKLEAEAAQQRDARKREEAREARAKLESDLMAKYRQTVPGASQADARQALPRLLEEWRQQQAREVAAADEERRARYSRLF